MSAEIEFIQIKLILREEDTLMKKKYATENKNHKLRSYEFHKGGRYMQLFNDFFLSLIKITETKTTSILSIIAFINCFPFRNLM